MPPPLSNPPTKPMPPPKPLTLIVAATSSLGIGHSGSLPWPRLTHEMASFARITKTLGLPIPAALSTRLNAVIMGRKTWLSIPPRFRPLPNRLNIVLSSTLSQSDLLLLSSRPSTTPHQQDDTPHPVVASTLPDALTYLSSLPPTSVANIFVIGGASVYAAALALPQTDRVLFTKVGGEWECDAFFPLDLEGEEGRLLGWRLAGEGERRAWVGEEEKEEGRLAVAVVDGEGRVKEGGVEYWFCMYLKEGRGA